MVNACLGGEKDETDQPNVERYAGFRMLLANLVHSSMEGGLSHALPDMLLKVNSDAF